MSHFSVLVVGDNPEDQLAPYQEYDGEDSFPREYLQFRDMENDEEERKRYETGTDSRKKLPYREIHKTFRDYLLDSGYDLDPKTGKVGYWRNPNAKWDWYSLGGRWTGFFKLKDGAVGQVGHPGLMTDPAMRGHADSARKQDIDFDSMRMESEILAMKEYGMLEKAFGGKIPRLAYRWTDFLDSPEFRHLDIDKKRELYHGQFPIKRLAELRKKVFEDKTIFEFERNFLMWADLEDFQHSPAVHAKKARDRACTTFAVLKHGKWYSKGDMGWWGMVANEQDQDVWNWQFHKLINDLPDDTILSVYDCHI